MKSGPKREPRTKVAASVRGNEYLQKQMLFHLNLSVKLK
jgi:hypothetical protein